MPKPLLGSQIAQDTFEKLQDQAQDVGQTVKDVVTGQDPTSSRDAGLRGAGQEDSGIEQLVNQQDDSQQPASAKALAGKQGVTPQQILQRQQGEKKEMEELREGIARLRREDEEQLQKTKQKESEKQKAEEVENQQKIEQIEEQRREQAKEATLNPQKPSTPKGPGSAFIQQSTKSQTEFSKQAVQ